MEKFNEIDLTADRREMGMGRAIVLLIASLLLWCGSMLLFLDLANVSDNQWQVALIGSLMAAIGGSWLWADFFGVTAWFARERWVTGYIAQEIPPAFMPKVLHKRGAFVDQENSQAGDAEDQVQEVGASQAGDAEGHVQEVSASQACSHD